MTPAGREPPRARAQGDVRLARALRVFDQQHLRVLSLDVFDTLVWRAVPEPVAAFVLVGHRLRDLGHLPGHVTPELFGRVRVKAEERARELSRSRTRSSEVSLHSIYDRMPPELVGGLPSGELSAIEVAVEGEISFPDLEVVDLARLARDEYGMQVVLVSDTYLSAAHLNRMLDRPPFTEIDVKATFTSSDHGVGKASGLFRVVLDALAVAAEEVLHVGDNEESDVTIPAQAGIHAVHFPRLPGEMGTILRREGVGVTGACGQTSGLVDPLRGDIGLTALRSKAAFRAEGGGLAPGIIPYWQTGASVLGPLFTGYAEWAHRRAGEEGVSRIYCVMREGEFLARLLNGARRYLGSPVRAVPLWLSRQTCARAAMLTASEDELSTFLSRRRPPRLGELCGALGISPSEMPELSGAAEGRLDDPQLWQRFLDAVAGSPDVRAAIVDNSSRLRKRLVQHFLSTVGHDVDRVVLADLGWAGTIQAYLQAALRAEGLEADLLGLYLLTHEGSVDRLLDGVMTDGYLAAGGLPEGVVRQIMRSPEILEQVCMTDVGSLVDFTHDGEPVTGPVSEAPVQMLQRVAVQGGIIAFQDEWARYGDVVPAGSRSLDDGRARRLLLRVLSRFVVSPTTTEARMFGSWSHDENYGSEGTETLLAEEMAPLLGYMTPAQFMSLPMQKVYWGYGLAARFRPALAQAAAAITQGEVAPEAFDPGEARLVTVSVHSHGALTRLRALLPGRMLSPLSGLLSMITGARATKPTGVWSGGEGLCFLREEIWSQSIRGVQVDFPAGPGVVRLDRMSLDFSLRGRPDPLRVEVEWPQRPGDVTYARCRSLADNLLYGPRRAPRVMYNCPSEWGSDAYRVEVEIAFAWLPTGSQANGTPTALERLYRTGLRLRRRLVPA